MDYTWDTTTRRFRDPSARFVSRVTVRQVLDNALNVASAEARQHAQDLIDGKTDADTWLARMRALTRDAIVASGAIGAGGKAGLTPSLLGGLGAACRIQYAYLASLHYEIRNGLSLDGRFLARCAMYPLAGTAAYEAVLRAGDIAAGMTRERRICRIKGSCAGCIAEARKGWQPVGVLKSIGECECLSACRCSFVRKRPKSKVAAMSHATTTSTPAIPDPEIASIWRSFVTFAKGGGAKAPKASKGKSDKPGAKATQTKGAVAAAKPGGCGTGAGGFQKGNNCGAKHNRNQTVLAHQKAHTVARREVSKHLKKGTVHTAEGRAAIKNAAAAHRTLSESRATHRETKRTERNAAARERRAVASGKASAIGGKPVATAKLATPANSAKPTASQARPAPTDKGPRADRLGVLVERHQRKADELTNQAREHFRESQRHREMAVEKGKQLPSPRADAAMERGRALSQRAGIHQGVAAKLGEQAKGESKADKGKAGSSESMTRHEVAATTKPASHDQIKASVMHAFHHADTLHPEMVGFRPKAEGYVQHPSDRSVKIPELIDHVAAKHGVSRSAVEKAIRDLDDSDHLRMVAIADRSKLKDHSRAIAGENETFHLVKPGTVPYKHGDVHPVKSDVPQPTKPSTPKMSPADRAAQDKLNAENRAKRDAFLANRQATQKAAEAHAIPGTPAHSHAPAAHLPVKDFADRVVSAAHASPTGGFGNSKTFISHVKAHLDRTDPAFRGMSDEAFKSRLLEAHQGRHLELGRADLVEAMHPADVAASKVPIPGSGKDVFGNPAANYHFVRHPEKTGGGKAQSALPAHEQARAGIGAGKASEPAHVQPARETAHAVIAEHRAAAEKKGASLREQADKHRSSKGVSESQRKSRAARLDDYRRTISKYESQPNGIYQIQTTINALRPTAPPGSIHARIIQYGEKAIARLRLKNDPHAQLAATQARQSAIHNGKRSNQPKKKSVAEPHQATPRTMTREQADRIMEAERLRNIRRMMHDKGRHDYFSIPAIKRRKFAKKKGGSSNS